MKSWGPLSRHETAEGGRGPARPARRMPGLSSHRAYGYTSKFAAGESARPAKQPVLPAQRPLLASEQPEQPVQSAEQSAHSSDLRARAAELRRLFTTFGYLVAKQGATAVLGLVYLVVATHLFSARDVGLAAAASSTAFFLGSVGALGIHSSCWPNSARCRPRSAASLSAPGCISRVWLS